MSRLLGRLSFPARVVFVLIATAITLMSAALVVLGSLGADAQTATMLAAAAAYIAVAYGIVAMGDALAAALATRLRREH